MPLLIGIDEAGYGPNLGPLVVAATVWDVPGDPHDCDPWSLFEGVVSPVADRHGRTVQIADSKIVHAASAGIAAIERSATALLRLAGRSFDSFYTLWDGLSDGHRRLDCGEPWYCEHDLALPLSMCATELDGVIERWRGRCDRSGCRLVEVACDVVPARQFNASLHTSGSKGRLLSDTTLALLKRVWNPASGVSALVLCDKHGGRNRYADLLADAFPDCFPLGIEESTAVSRYRIGSSEIRFQARSECHLPVAAASILAKYLREASMEAMNRYWLARRPALRPTRGYPVDARRYLAEIETDAASLGLARDSYWRLK